MQPHRFSCSFKDGNPDKEFHLMMWGMPYGEVRLVPDGKPNATMVDGRPVEMTVEWEEENKIMGATVLDPTYPPHRKG
jgi:hypothetical protein